VELLAPEAAVSNLADRMRFAPFGVLGGGAGAKTEIELRQNGAARAVAKETGLTWRQGDRIRLRYPGGGGYGDPYRRDAALVQRDVRRGYVSPTRARAAFGVELQPESLAVDEAATATRREGRGR
jgi:N-methylhydantoinase B